MTVPSTRFREDYAGNGSATSFPYAFRIFKATDLVVTKTDSSGTDTTLTLGTDYTVTGAGSYNGGAVVLTTALPTSYRLTIERVLSIKQETDLRNQGEFLAETHEDAFDRLTMIVQRLAGYLGMGQGGTLRTLLLGTGDVDGAGAFRARGNRISGLGDPVDDADAAGKRWTQEQIASAVNIDGSSMLGVFAITIDAIAGASGLLWPDKATVIARGRDTVGDGGGGPLRFLKGSTATANGVTIYAVPGGRLVREGWSLSGFSGVINVKWAGAKGDGVTEDTDDTAAIQNAASCANSIEVNDGVYRLSQTVVMPVPKSFFGHGANTIFESISGFTGSIFRLAPAAGTDPKGWTLSNFEVKNSGSATDVFLLDIADAGEYLSKLTISKIVSSAPVSNYFVELLNSVPNIDGLFTSVFSDNWSYGGYYLDNVGDSVILERNTTTGDGVGYYVNQLGTAANIIIRDGNCTSAAGALRMVKGANLVFEGMQVECPHAFTGADNAAISINRPSGGSIYNTKITNNNINTQGNPLYCIYINNAVQTKIDGNELYCDPATGAHIYIDTGARDTIIGNNKYYSSVTGAEIDPIIVNNGVGTTGVWVDATLTLSGWSNQNTSNEHASGYFKDRDGNVQLRGRVAGSAATAGQTLFTLPVGYRPKTKGYLIQTYGSSAYPSIVLQILPTGAVQILTAGTTGVYLSGIVFSTK